MKTYDTYLFDWDGTLANTMEVWVAAMHANLLPYGLNLPKETLIEHAGDWSGLVPYGLPASELMAYIEVTRAYALDKLVDAPLYDGVRTMLINLRARDKRLAIVTAGHRLGIEAMLRVHDLTSFFEVVVSSTDVANLKPHPESLLLALDRLGVTYKDRAVMVGDNSRDLLAARRAGVDSILFAHPDSNTEIEELVAIHQPIAVVHSWSEFTF